MGRRDPGNMRALHFIGPINRVDQECYYDFPAYHSELIEILGSSLEWSIVFKLISPCLSLRIDHLPKGFSR